MKDRYDVVVVGGGPAGSLAAKYAAENGVDALIVEKEKELGVPLQCAEGLYEGALTDLGIDPDPQWAVNKIDSAELVSPSGKRVEISSGATGPTGYILDRKAFDEYLGVQAVRSGSDILMNAYVDGLIQEEEMGGVTISSSDGKAEVRGEVVIAADGVNSRVGRLAGVDTALGPMEIESCSQFKMAGIDIEDRHSLEFYFGEEIAPGGYIWVFPKGEDTANVGIGVLPGLAEKPSIEYLKDFISSKPELKKGGIVGFNAGGVPVSGPLERTVTDGLLIVGDAARLVNPMTGGGINFAMKSGKMAGEVAADAVSEGNTSEERLMEYENRVRERIGEDLKKYKRGKDVLIDLSDEELDNIAETIQEADIEKISLTKMMKKLATSNPELVWGLKEFL